MNDSTQSAERPARPLAYLALAVAAGWILTGAMFKLFVGSPALLPAFMHELPISVGTIYPLVIGIEMAIVTLALLRPRLGWWLVALQYVAFFVVLSIQIYLGEESCGCMGGDVSMTPTTMLGIDAAIFAILLSTRPWSGLGRFSLPLPLAIAVALVVFVVPRFVGRGQAIDPAELADRLASAQAASVDADPAGKQAEEQVVPVETLGWEILDPAKWVGKDVFEISLGGFVDVATLPLDGLWIFYRTTCDHCRDHLIEVANSDDQSSMIGLIRVPEPGDTPDNRVVHIMPSGGHVVHAELLPGVEYVMTTPADAVIVGAVVQSAREGIEPGEYSQ